jgi:adenylate cyclase
MRKQQATLLSARLLGFPKITETITADALAVMIHGLFDNLAPCVDELDGHLERCTGEGLVAVFGAPVKHGDHALRALVCATQLLGRHREWMTKRRGEELPAPPLGIGIDTGPVFVGDVEMPQGIRYVTLGHATNLSARLSDVAKDGQILITPNLHAAASSRLKTYSGGVAVPRLAFESLGPQRFRDVETPVQVLSARSKR